MKWTDADAPAALHDRVPVTPRDYVREAHEILEGKRSASELCLEHLRAIHALLSPRDEATRDLIHETVEDSRDVLDALEQSG